MVPIISNGKINKQKHNKPLQIVNNDTSSIGL